MTVLDAVQISATRTRGGGPRDRRLRLDARAEGVGRPSAPDATGSLRGPRLLRESVRAC
ncbi:hypothetical protein QJS66_01930 [Kocuria rhizophila]|nr:hypothetical protein QJS66_01930 [Kocuria rhizophila]